LLQIMFQEDPLAVCPVVTQLDLDQLVQDCRAQRIPGGREKVRQRHGRGTGQGELELVRHIAELVPLGRIKPPWVKGANHPSLLLYNDKSSECELTP
jgi:hypothetical protein